MPKAKNSNRDDLPGTILEDAFILRVDVGTATEGDNEYDLSTNAGNGSPIIHNKKTGKYFTIGWEELIDLAREKGIDNPEPLTDEEE